MQEEKVSSSAHFITLTYDTKSVPLTAKGFMGISKVDLQLFFKRLRKAHERVDARSIKYFAVGEYGSRTFRPHYHVILFNANVELIQKAWQNGDVHYGEVSGASIGYCLKYMSKRSKVPLHKNDDRCPEFALMSKGLGMAYLTKNMVAWHKADLENRMYVNVEGGKKASMCRYYKDKIYDENERMRIAEAYALKMSAEKVSVNSRDKGEAILAAFEKMDNNSKKHGSL